MKPASVSGGTKLSVIIGDPLAHSLSPAIHNHVYAVLGLPFVYVPLKVAKQELSSVLLGLRACKGFAGGNVTIPHKSGVLPFCDVISPLSRLTGTVNTLYMHDGLLHATTTDWDGFLRAMAWMNFDLKGSSIAILGNGGTARTLGFALAATKIPAALTIIGRNSRNAELLSSEIVAAPGFRAACDSFSSPTLAETLARSTLCVNCTPVGMHPDVSSSPLDKSFLHPGLAVFDAIYNPKQTALLRHAESAGCRVQGGLRMLVYQALASAKYWTGVGASDDVVPFDELQAMAEGACE